MSTAESRLRPDTSVLHLDFNAGEDVDIEVLVTDRAGQPLPLTAAVGTIGMPGASVVLHEWSTAAGNLVVFDQSSRPGVVLLSSTSAETRAWFAAWGDAEWQLDTVDVFGRSKRACEGDVRVSPTRRPTP